MKITVKRILAGLVAFVAVVIVFTVIVNLRVEYKADGRLYDNVDSIPHNREALLSGEKIDNPEPHAQKSYSTIQGVTLEILNIAQMTSPVDSIVLEIHNQTDSCVTYGEWFELQSRSGDAWNPVKIDPRYEGNDSTVYIVWNAIAYILFPHMSSKKTEKPWFYGENLVPGHYRLAKHIFVGEYTHINDTVYVEFDIK